MRCLADFSIDSDLCLPDGAAPLRYESPDGTQSLTLSNATRNPKEQAAVLSAQLLFETEQLDEETRDIACENLAHALNRRQGAAGSPSFSTRIRRSRASPKVHCAPKSRPSLFPPRRVDATCGGEDFAVTSGWGHYRKGDVVMPCQGLVVERSYTPDERDTLGDALPVLGENTFDVHLNESALWRNVPGAIWNYKPGGYQVIKKWLSYRERAILGRSLEPHEIQHFTDSARRVGEILMRTANLGPTSDRELEDWRGIT